VQKVGQKKDWIITSHAFNRLAGGRRLSVNMRSIMLRIVSAIAALILSTTVMAAGTRCPSSDFACFKRKMMPQVGRKITVVGVLASAKLGWIVTFKNWGIYIYAVQDSDNSRMKAFDSFNGSTVKVTGTLRYSPGSPTPRTDVASVPEHFFFDVAEAKVISTRPAAEMTFREMRFRKPPLVELYFDVVLRNDRSEPRWFLLPSNLGPEPTSIAAKGGVDGVEVFASRGKARVIVGHFLGTGGFYALLLPARAEVRLRSFPISYWGDLPEHLQVEIAVAKRLTIGSEPAKVWFGVNPMSRARADIAENPLNQKWMVRAKRTPDNKEVPTKIEVDRRFELSVPLARK
jgi:hypothetical protein